MRKREIHSFYRMRKREIHSFTMRKREIYAAYAALLS